MYIGHDTKGRSHSKTKQAENGLQSRSSENGKTAHGPSVVFNLTCVRLFDRNLPWD